MLFYGVLFFGSLEVCVWAILAAFVWTRDDNIKWMDQSNLVNPSLDFLAVVLGCQATILIELIDMKVFI